MGDLFTIDLEGTAQLLKKLKSMSSEIQQEVDAELGFSIEEIRNMAIESAPVDKGRLRQGISSNKDSVMNYSIASNVLYSPYVEFGTGDYVSVPRGFEEGGIDLSSYAIQFKGAGVRKVNLVARPFFFPALFFVSPKIVQRIQKILDNP